MRYCEIQPEVAGNIALSHADWSRHPPVVTKLHYEFDDWLGDVVLQSFPCYMVTAEVAVEIERAGFTGATMDSAETSRSELFMDIDPALYLPEFRWLKVNGELCRDDVAVSPEHNLVISERLLNFLHARGLNHAEVIEYPYVQPSTGQCACEEGVRLRIRT